MQRSVLKASTLPSGLRAARSHRATSSRLRRRCVVASAATASFDSFDATKSIDLPYDRRQSVLAAMEELDCSATPAEVAARAGLPISETERLLQWLTLESKGSMRVTEDGDLIYSIPSNSRQAMMVQSAELRAEAAARAAGATAVNVGKFVFAGTLYASIALCVVLLIFLSIAGNSDSDNRGRRGGGFVYFPDFWLLTDDRARARGRTRSHGRRNAQNGEEEPADVSMTFMQAVTSWVFGDGDPNAGFEDARWAAAASYIQAHGGVVAAEEMRPFLDGVDDSSASGEEAYMLPLLLRLEGEAVIDDGMLLYRFPELQKRARAEAAAPKWRLGGMVQRGAERVNSLVFGEPLDGSVKAVGPETTYLAPVGDTAVAQKKSYKLTNATPAQFYGVLTLALVNIALVSTVWPALATRSGILSVAQISPILPGLLLKFVFPFLGLYASLYAVGPLVRGIANWWRNNKIAKDNAKRVAAAKALQNASPDVQAKIGRARQLGTSQDVSQKATVFDTTASNVEHVERDNWDARFHRSGQ